jgi:hypothetical protein
LPHFAFRATLRDGAAGSQPIASGLWTSTTTGLALLARSESPAPATPFGFADFLNSPTLHGSTVTFWARLSGLGTGLGSNEAIYSGTPGSLTLKVLEGAQAAGCPAGTLHLGLTRIPAAAASGAIAFGSLLAGPGITTNNDSGIWSISPAGAITLLAREGDQAPRLPAGTLYAGFEGPSISNSGRIIILARLRGPGVTSANNRALLVTDPTGRIYPILRTGDTFGAPRLIDEIVFDHGQPQSGRTALLDDAPDLTLALKLILRDRYQPPASGYSHAIITASLGCLADMDGDGLITVNDFMRFLLYFNSNNLRACDFSGNGVLDVTDFIGFINAVNTPCP